MIEGTCIHCGCTDNNCKQCIEASGEPCWWIDDTHTVCSRCYFERENLDVMTDEQKAIKELRSMNREQLDLVPYDTVKWLCLAKGCCNGTKVRDYGIAPYYWRQKMQPSEFIDTSHYFWLCGKHNKLHKRLEKNFPLGHIYTKLMDPNKETIINLKPKE